MSKEDYFERAFQEVRDKKPVQALWAKAIVEADGDQSRTIARYIKLRAEQIEAETEVSQTDLPPQNETPSRQVDWQIASAPRRLVARLLDFSWQAVVAGLLIAFIPAVEILNDPAGEADILILGILITPVALLLDALVYSVFGSTPGKALLRVRVVDQDSKLLDGQEYLMRNTRLWVQGLAFGLPVIALITAGYQAYLIHSGRYASYDGQAQHCVESKPAGFLRITFAAALLMLFFAINGLLKGLPGETSNTAPPSTARSVEGSSTNVGNNPNTSIRPSVVSPEEPNLYKRFGIEPGGQSPAPQQSDDIYADDIYSAQPQRYRLAAERGDAVAQNKLGFMYKNGYGVTRNHTEAVRWYRLAAEQGYAVAQSNLGLMYENGYGVPKSLVQAYFWFNLAAAQGNEAAIENRRALEQQMTREQIAEAQRLTRAR